MQTSDPKDYPYVTRLDVRYKPLEIVDEKALAELALTSGSTRPCAK